ncbi:MAG: DMT family transporter [Anaerolineales bacterium]
MPQTASRSSQGFFIALAATFLWSTTGPLISYITIAYNLPALILAFWRDLFVSFGMLAGLALLNRSLFQLDRRHAPFMILYGFTLAVFNSVWTFSVKYNGASVATVMAFSSPAMTALLSYFILKERFSAAKIFSILLSFVGIVFVSGAYNPAAWNLNPLGILFGLLSGFMFAVYNVQGKRASDANINAWTAMLYSFAVASIFLFFFTLGNDFFVTRRPLMSDLLWLGSSAGGWGLLFLLGVIPTLGGFGLYTLSIRYLSPTVSNLIATLEPALTAVLAYFFLSEIMSAMQLFGGALLLTGVILLRAQTD